MKVLMVVSWYSPKDAEVMSAGVFHYEQSMALKKYAETALYYPNDTDISSPFEEGEERGLYTYRRKKPFSKIPKMSALKQTFVMIRDLKKICKKFKPDVIHAHCVLMSGFVASLFGKLYGYPVVITEHSPIEHFDLNNKLYMAMARFGYYNSCVNVCVSNDSKNKLKAVFPKCDYSLIYNGIYSPDKVEKTGKTYRIDGKINCCIVAAFYSIDIKGYQHLIPAIADVKKRGVNIVLHICGGGDYFEHFVNMAKDLGLENDIIFYGNCTKSEVYSIVSQMDFNISASLYECSGVSVEEALLLGKPMLVTRSGGANSLVNDKVALVVDKGSTKALADGIVKMVDRLSDFDSEEIYDYAFKNFEIDQVSQQYMKLYNKISEKKQ